MTETTPLIDRLRAGIIKEMNLFDLKPEEIDPDAPLIGGGLGLDSIDGLELVLMLERQYGLKVTDSKEARKILRSVRTLAGYITEHGKG